MLIDENPSAAFISLEKRKQGYSNITKINKPNPIYLTPKQGGSLDEKINPKKILLTDPVAVRQHMQYFMQTIFTLQDDITPEKEHIFTFLSSGEDLGNPERTRKSITKHNRKKFPGRINY